MHGNTDKAKFHTSSRTVPSCGGNEGTMKARSPMLHMLHFSKTIHFRLEPCIRELEASETKWTDRLRLV